ncbi:MAG TPA: hypothetical protein VJU59_18860 [Paraburkholderia sp.]|uniref:hypothetical protein n=1 Tax=Paraburkholderia sp. TaxID=1926495 RepID=UPI002B49CEDB|nr:hypothetical protein [Paraburkholderia sp.]HKR41703.1 hypothetical protein [Paraburkholderia sp.]
MASTQANAAQPVRVCAAHPSLMHALNGVLPVMSFLFCAVASIVQQFCSRIVDSYWL